MLRTRAVGQFACARALGEWRNDRRCASEFYRHYNLLLNQTYEYYASNAHAGHTGLRFGIRDGQGNTPMLTQGETITTNWLDYYLNGNATAGTYFFGAGCGLCVQPEWTVTTNIQ